MSWYAMAWITLSVAVIIATAWLALAHSWWCLAPWPVWGTATEVFLRHEEQR